MQGKTEREMGYPLQEQIANADKKESEKRNKRNKARRERHQVMLDMGLKRVKGALGGTYYE